MSLFEDMMVPCVRLERTRVQDGEGGWTTQWAEGDAIMAAIHRESDSDVLRAEKQASASEYTITVKKGVQMAFHDVIRRVSDGSTYRIVSDSAIRETPDVASFAFARCRAEAYDLESEEAVA